MEEGKGAFLRVRGLLRLVVPWAIFERVWEVPLEGLRREGVKGLILDYDNTLALWRGPLLRESRGWMERALRAGVRLCVLSNAARGRRVKRALKGMGVKVEARALKPLPFSFRRAARRMGLRPEEVVVVGDQIFTDVLGGNLAGMRTILVRPLGRREFVTTYFVRVLEGLVLRALRARGLGRPSGL